MHINITPNYMSRAAKNKHIQIEKLQMLNDYEYDWKTNTLFPS